MYPRLFYSRIKFFYLHFDKCFETTNSFLRKYFKEFYKPPPENLIRVGRKRRKQNFYNKNGHGENIGYDDYDSYRVGNYFNKKLPELDEMTNKELDQEYNQVRKSIMERSKFMYLCQRTISYAKLGKKYNQIGKINSMQVNLNSCLEELRYVSLYILHLKFLRCNKNVIDLHYLHLDEAEQFVGIVIQELQVDN